jgi:hypothetical protein
VSDTPARPFLKIELDPVTWNVAVTGAVVNANMELLLAMILFEQVRARFRSVNTPKGPAIAVPDYTWKPRGPQS